MDRPTAQMVQVLFGTLLKFREGRYVGKTLDNILNRRV